MLLHESVRPYYKMFIPCAGTGSRLNLQYNKALTTVGYQPVIAHIIDKIPQEVEIVIALGYDGNNVQQVVEILYPERPITYINIDPYEGPESGLGLTLLQSKDELQCPFIFCPCDTIVQEEIPPPNNNWMGLAKTSLTSPIPDMEYRSFRTGISEAWKITCGADVAQTTKDISLSTVNLSS